MQETVDCINLIRDLTNGKIPSDGTTVGIGCGLPLLYPWKDTPAFYELQQQHSNNTGTNNMMQGNWMSGFGQSPPPHISQSQGQYPYNPHQPQQDANSMQWKTKDAKEWEKELICSLWTDSSSSDNVDSNAAPEG
eukprot:11151196-Ditylum_brightwellii.AAC.1